MLCTSSKKQECIPKSLFLLFLKESTGIKSWLFFKRFPVSSLFSYRIYKKIFSLLSLMARITIYVLVIKINFYFMQFNGRLLDKDSG